MSHIFNHVRLDAVKVLDLLLTFCPDAFREGNGNGEEMMESSNLFKNNEGAKEKDESLLSNGERTLKCYLTLLGISYGSDGTVSSTFGTASTTSTDLSTNSKLLLLKSFGNFVKVISTTPSSSVRLAGEGMSAQEEEDVSISCPTWFFAPSFRTSSSDFESFRRFLRGDLLANESFDFEQDLGNEDFKSIFTNGNKDGDRLMDLEVSERGLGVGDLNTILNKCEGFMDFEMQIEGIQESKNLRQR